MATESPDAGSAPDTIERGHEPRDVSVPWIAAVAAGLVLLAFVVQLALWLQMHGMWRARQHALPPASPLASALPAAPPEPRLQTAPELDLRDLRRQENAQLGGYGWVDRQHGVIHIPIDRAMALVASEARR